MSSEVRIPNNEQMIWLNKNDLEPRDYNMVDRETAQNIRRQWRRQFIDDVQNYDILHKCSSCTGSPSNSYDWHAFTFSESYAQNVDETFVKRRLSTYYGPVYLMWEACDAPVIIMQSRLASKLEWEGMDIYIFDINIQWTIIVTHEGWMFYKESLKLTPDYNKPDVDV